MIAAANSVPIGVAFLASAGAFGVYLPFGVRDSRRLEMEWAAEAQWEIAHPTARIIAISPSELSLRARGSTTIAGTTMGGEPAILWWRAPSGITARAQERELEALSWRAPKELVATVLSWRAPQHAGDEPGEEMLAGTVDDDLATAAA